MPKQISTVLKLQLPAGQASPAPPVGPALGAAGVNIMQFVKEYNERTQKLSGNIVPVELTVYVDRSFDMQLKTPPASDMIKKAAGVDSASGRPGIEIIGKISSSNNIWFFFETKTFLKIWKLNIKFFANDKT